MIQNPSGHTKLAHQFWFSFPPPGAGGSSNSKTPQTDEEKQRDRQRNEREQKNAEQDAINYRKDRDAREARLLDFEIRRANEKDRKREVDRQQHILKHQQQQPQQIQQQQSQSEKSTPSSINTLISEVKSPREIINDTNIPSGSGGGTGIGNRTRSLEQETQQPSTSQKTKKDLEKSHRKHQASTTPSPQTLAGPPPSRSVVAGPPATAAAATAAIIPILPLGVATLRDDSTESDQSLTLSQAPGDAFHRSIIVNKSQLSLACGGCSDSPSIYLPVVSAYSR